MAAQCIHLADPLPVPHVSANASLTAVLHESWPVYTARPLPAGMAHPVENDSIRTRELQATCEFLRREVAVRS